MSVSNGQRANATTFNGAFPSRVDDTSMAGVVELNNPDSGPTVENVQQAINDEIDRGDTQDTDIAALQAKFDETTGHAHSGDPGDGAPIDSGDIANVPLLAFNTPSLVLENATSTSDDVTSLMSTYDPSSDASTPGVPVNTDQNRVLLRHSGGTRNGRPFYDTEGNEVYGRLTESSGTWTLSYYSDIEGVETAYSFEDSPDLVFYFQLLVNPLATSPAYNALVPVLLNATAGTSATGGGVGQGMRFEPADDVPPVIRKTATTNIRVADFESDSSIGSGPWIVATFRVPDDYIVGTPITLSGLQVYSEINTGNFNVKGFTVLTRPGSDAVDDASNSWNSTNAQTAISGTAKRVTTCSDIDLTNGSGQIGGVDPTPGDYITVFLARHTATGDVAGTVSVLMDSGTLVFG